MKSIAIIGAGPGGLCAARRALEAGHQVTVFEQNERLGGTWVYVDGAGSDANGVEIHSSLYQGLVTNLPKEIMCFPDVPMPEQIASYVTAAEILAYLDAFADRFAVRQHVRFAHQVVRVRPIVRESPAPVSWEIIVRDVKHRDPQRIETLHFDAVFVCNGSNISEPRLPVYPDRELYTGRTMHSHAYRKAEEFAGRSVLIIGFGPSALDVAAGCGKYAERVAISHRREVPPNLIPDSWVRPAVERFTPTGVVFTDGREEAFTDVIYATGYNFTFPFLSTECGVHVEQQSYVRPMYKECINIEQPTMYLLGLPYYNIPMQMMDLQARFCLAYLDGSRTLPSKADMLSTTAVEMQQRLDKYDGDVRYVHKMDSFQQQYYDDLAQLGGLEPVRPYVCSIFDDSVAFMYKDAKRFRLQRYRVVSDTEFVKTMADEE